MQIVFFWKQWYTPEDANDAANVGINSQKGFIYIFIHSFIHFFIIHLVKSTDYGMTTRV